MSFIKAAALAAHALAVRGRRAGGAIGAIGSAALDEEPHYVALQLIQGHAA